MKKLLIIGLTVAALALTACSDKTDIAEEKEVPKAVEVPSKVAQSTVLTKEDIGFYHASRVGNAVFHIDNQEAADRLWSEYEVDVEQPKLGEGKEYYLFTFGHGGCEQEVEGITVEGSIIKAGLTEITEMMCTMQFISRTTIVEVKDPSEPIANFEFSGNAGEVRKLSEFLVEVDSYLLEERKFMEENSGEEVETSVEGSEE